jgi:predicted dehydrogenase
MAERIRIGIIGCGQIAQHHMKTYAGIEGAHMTAFCDANLAAAQKAVEDFGPGDAVDDFRWILERDDIDAVDVCLHNNLHAPVTIAALQAGKHVYCEKPMAGSFADAEAMHKAAAASGKHLHIQLSTLYADETRAARELIADGHLGEVFHARSAGFRRRGRPYVDGYGTPSFVQKSHASGGALYDMGVYHIARILHLMDSPTPERISGRIYQKTDMDQARRDNSGYDVEELGLGFIRFTDGRTMELAESWAAMLDTFGGSFLLGSKGGVRLDPFGFFTSLGHISIDATARLGEARYRWDNVVGDGGVWGDSQRHWIAALQGHIELLPTADIALNTMLISEGVYLSSELGREVTADEVREKSVSTARQV